MCNTITGLGLHLALDTAEPVAAAFLEFRSSVFWRAYDMVRGLPCPNIRSLLYSQVHCT
jgi:hypothetical protein